MEEDEEVEENEEVDIKEDSPTEDLVPKQAPVLMEVEEEGTMSVEEDGATAE